MAVLHRLAAILAGLAGLMFALVPVLHPPNTIVGALQPAWLPVHLAWLVSYLLILFALPTLFLAASQTPTGSPATTATSALPLTGFLLAFTGTALSIPIATYDTYIVPTLAADAPPLIAFINQTVEEPAITAFHATYYLAIATFSLGFILLGIALSRVPGLPRWAGPLMAVGAPLFWIGVGFRGLGERESFVTMAGAILFGAGLMVVGQGIARKTVLRTED